VIDGIPAARDASDLDERRFAGRPEIAGVFAEGTVERRRIRLRPAFDDDLRVGWNEHALTVRDRRREPQRLADDTAGGAPVALRIAQLRLSAEQYGRVMADPERDGARFAALPELAQVARVVARRIRKPGHAPRPLYPAPLDRGVVDAGIGIERRGVRRRQVRTGLELVLRQHGQRRQIRGIALLHQFLHRRRGPRHEDGIDAVARAICEPAGGRAVIGNAERPGHDFAACREVRHDRCARRAAAHGRNVGGEKDRIAAARIELVLERRQLMARADLGVEAPCHCPVSVEKGVEVHSGASVRSSCSHDDWARTSRLLSFTP
jgi:hypothetical protein